MREKGREIIKGKFGMVRMWDKRWWSGVAVARWFRSTKLIYVGPG